jgi:hypothetical protein
MRVNLRRVWIYQRGDRNTYIKETQTTQGQKEKVQKDKQRSTKHTNKTKDRATRTPSYKHDEKSSMRKGLGSVYDKCKKRGHLWHRYSIVVNQVMVATVKLSKWCLQLN